VCDDSRVADFIGERLTGSRFGGACLTDASFHGVDLSNARFRLVDMTGVVIGGAALKDMSISGWIDNLLVNGIDTRARASQAQVVSATQLTPRRSPG
jgi:uncharacterized protein YjbI with pentapeptide repeats